MALALKMSMGDQPVAEEEPEEGKLLEIGTIDHSEFTTRVKAYVSRVVSAILKGMREGQLSLDVDVALSIIRVASVGQQ